MNRHLLFVPLVAATVVLAGDRPGAQQAAGAPEATTEAAQPKTEAAQPKTEEAQSDKGPRVTSGMSVLGNQDAPKALVLVPWKGSELGASMGVSTVLDDSRQPVDKDVFMRALRYYEIRSETAAQSATAAPRRK